MNRFYRLTGWGFVSSTIQRKVCCFPNHPECGYESTVEFLVSNPGVPPICSVRSGSTIRMTPWKLLQGLVRSELSRWCGLGRWAVGDFLSHGESSSHHGCLNTNSAPCRWFCVFTSHFFGFQCTFCGLDMVMLHDVTWCYMMLHDVTLFSYIRIFSWLNPIFCTLQILAPSKWLLVEVSVNSPNFQVQR